MFANSNGNSSYWTIMSSKIQKRWKQATTERTALSTFIFLLHLRCTEWKDNKIVLYDIVLLVESNTNKGIQHFSV